MEKLNRIIGNDRLSKYVDSEFLGSGNLDLDTDYIGTIKTLWQAKVSTGGKAEQQVGVTFAERYLEGGDGRVEAKPFILNATNRRTLKKLFGGDSAAQLEGQRIIIHVETGVRDPRGGGTTEGLRIRARRPQAVAQILVCADCGTEIKGFGALTAAQTADITRRKYGVPLCSDRGSKRKAAQPADDAAAGTAPNTAADAEAVNEATAQCALL